VRLRREILRSIRATERKPPAGLPPRSKRPHIKPRSKAGIVTICGRCFRSYDPADPRKSQQHATRRH
jgi:hypothetical protein